jgi:hypothetical protein
VTSATWGASRPPSRGLFQEGSAARDGRVEVGRNTPAPHATHCPFYDSYLNYDENIKIGEVLEASHDQLNLWGHPDYKSGAVAQRTERVFEPWFKGAPW